MRFVASAGCTYIHAHICVVIKYVIIDLKAYGYTDVFICVHGA